MRGGAYRLDPLSLERGARGWVIFYPPPASKVCAQALRRSGAQALRRSGPLKAPQHPVRVHAPLPLPIDAAGGAEAGLAEAYPERLGGVAGEEGALEGDGEVGGEGAGGGGVAGGGGAQVLAGAVEGGVEGAVAASTELKLPREGLHRVRLAGEGA